MKTPNIKLIIFIIICVLTCNSAFSQSLMVYHVVGEVTKTCGEEKQPVTINSYLHLDTEINIPFGGKLEVLDEESSRRIILKKPGCSTMLAMSKDNENSITDLSKKYIAYIKNQMRNKGLTSRLRYTDFACVTREIDSISTGNEHKAELTMEERFQKFKMEQNRQFASFREQCNRDYISFVRKSWERFEQTKGVDHPKDQKTTPIVAPNKSIIELEEGKVEEEIQVEKNMTNILTQPEPVEPIKETQENEPEFEDNKGAGSDMDFHTMPFEFFGTELQVRLDETKRINLGEINPNRVADALQHFSTSTYDNLIYDCLKIRQEYKLCDWAYLLMLKQLTDQFCGEGTNEAKLLMGYVFYQSGYKIRFATDNTKLFLLIASDHIIYGRGSYCIDNECFYPLDDIEGSIYICLAAFPKERKLSLYIPEQPLFKKKYDERREVFSQKYPEINMTFRINKNLLDFYNSYPASCINEDFTTRWMMYANTPLDTSIKEQIYPILSDRLKGLNELDAVERILNLVQTGFQYEYDDKIWGNDRTFFAEESLHYPFCDCEDRSILFTRLVRDLLNLECALIHYPGHLAAAVKFTNTPNGTYYTTQNGEKYTLCDPTYINASVGLEMPNFKNEKVNLIKLK